MPPAAATDNDTTLWAAIRQDNEIAFGALYERYWSVLYTTAYHYLRDKDACTDIVHDIFISIWNKRHELEVMSFRHYLTHATRYRVYKMLNHGKRGKIVAINVWNEQDAGISLNSGEDKLEYGDLEQKVNHYLGQLPKRCREIFLLSRKDNLSNDEIAARLDVSKRTVENQLTHALHHLRNNIEDITMAVIIFGSWYNA